MQTVMRRDMQRSGLRQLQLVRTVTASSEDGCVDFGQARARVGSNKAGVNVNHTPSIAFGHLPPNSARIDDFRKITDKDNLTVVSYSGRVKSPEWRRQLRRADLRQF